MNVNSIVDVDFPDEIILMILEHNHDDILSYIQVCKEWHSIGQSIISIILQRQIGLYADSNFQNESVKKLLSKVNGDIIHNAILAYKNKNKALEGVREENILNTLGLYLERTDLHDCAIRVSNGYDPKMFLYKAIEDGNINLLRWLESRIPIDFFLHDIKYDTIIIISPEITLVEHLNICLFLSYKCRKSLKYFKFKFAVIINKIKQYKYDWRRGGSDIDILMWIKENVKDKWELIKILSTIKNIAGYDRKYSHILKWIKREYNHCK